MVVDNSIVNLINIPLKFKLARTAQSLTHVSDMFFDVLNRSAQMGEKKWPIIFSGGVVRK